MFPTMGRSLRLPASITIAVVAGAVAVATGMALVLGNTISLRNSAEATIGTNEYLLSVSDVERLVVDAETGLRGYVITGHTLFLQPLNAALARFPATAGALQRAASHEHAFTGQAAQLISALRSYLTIYVPSVIRTVRRSPSAARSLAINLRGKQLVDAIRARTSALQNAVSVREVERQRRSRASAGTAIAEAIAVLVALTALTVLLGWFLGRLALARDSARARSEQTAEILQRSLLPHALPPVPGCELAVRFHPAGVGELVGGDFYDVFATAQGEWAIVLGDVCGKGAEAAAVTAMARWTLRSYAPETSDAAQPLRFLNESMLRQDVDARFITIVHLLVSIEHDRAHVSVACAGHPPPIRVPAGGEPVAVEARGPVLGVWEDIELETARLVLGPGDALVVYTDGVTDLGRGFSPEVPEVMLAGRGSRPSAEGLASALERYADQRVGQQRDDVAIVVLRFLGEGREGGHVPPEPELVHHAYLRD
jgi:serine phosphatase RsbU (regulator of sigma subunit)